MVDNSQRSEEYWAAYHFVRAIKGIMGARATAKILVGTTLRKLNSDTQHLAPRWFGQMAKEELYRHMPTGDVDVVPIPSKARVVGNDPGDRVLEAARELERASGGRVRVADALRWSESLPSTHRSGGSRDPRFLVGKLSFLEGHAPRHPWGQVVLLDDVCTSGAHIRACCWILESEAFPPDLAICAGRTCYDTAPGAFEVTRKELDCSQ